jgi:hypothetical protein
MKRLLIIPLLLLFTVAANAQLFTIFGQDCGFIYVGPKAGATYSTISNFSDQFPGVATKSKVGYQFGAVGEFGFTSKFSIQTELLFFSRGIKYKDIDGGIKMNYIGLPILAKYAFKAFGLTKVYAMGGTFTDVRTKGEWYDAGGTSQLGSGFKKYDWGFSFGAGAEYPTDKGIWALDFRYNIGMTDLHSGEVGDYKTRSRAFGLSLTYKYDITKLLPKNRKKGNTNEPTEAVAK